MANQYLERKENREIDYRNALVEKNLGLARYFAARYPDIEDALSIAYIGLIKAAEHYDPGYGVAFSTYAGKCIHVEVLMSQRKKQMPTVSLSMPITEDGSATLGDVLPDTSVDIEDAVLATVALEGMLSRLNGLGQQLFEAYYIERRTLTEMTAIFGGTKQNLSQKIRRLTAICRQEMEDMSCKIN